MRALPAVVTLLTLTTLLPGGRVDCGQSTGPKVVAAQASDRLPLPLTVFLLRHAEKVDDSRDPELSKVGVERANALARLLAQARVTHLFASEYKRTSTTLSPLSKSLGLRVKTISARSPKKQVAALAALPPGSVAVVAGHSNTIPKLCELLAGDAFARNPVPKIADDSYDRLFMVTMHCGVDRKRSTPQCIELQYGSRGK